MSEDLNRQRLGDHAFELFQKVCGLYNMSGPIADPDVQPFAASTFDFVRDDGSTVKLKLTLETVAPEGTEK
jgi:hypothetical protein